MRVLKNMKLSAKLISAFLTVVFIAVIIGIVGINGMTTLSREDEEMYKYNTKPMGYIAVMYDTLASQRICANNMVIFLSSDPEFSKEESESLSEKETLFGEAFVEYGKYLSNDTERSLYSSMQTLYYNDFVAIKQSVRDAVALGDAAAMDEAIKLMDDMGSQISGYMDEAFALNDKLASDKVASNKTLSVKNAVLLSVVMAAGALISILLAIFISSLISKPLTRMLAATKQTGEFGDFSFSSETVMAIKADAAFKDEIGQLSLSFSVMMDALIEKTKVLETIAEGDLTSKVRLVSNRDTIGIALEKMLNNLNRMFNDISASASQVASSSKQMADGAQNLAQGATEQAGTVEELSQAITQVADKTRQNAEMAGQAASLASTIKSSAEKGSHQMELMRQAVSEINDASQSINNVIKAIDDIAFQTNILALNAAVEAARAGQHGKGFAVVADEVRNLAQKSASSAKDTGELIANSMEKTSLGVKIADETFSSLIEIVAGINESNRIINEMAKSSEDQSEAVIKINSGIEQVSQVVQQNSATAEESAAASEQMSGQAGILESLVSQFKIKGSQGLKEEYQSVRGGSDGMSLKKIS